MNGDRSSGRGRVVRTRRSPSPTGAASALADIDRRLLDVLCTHRVARQDQLCRLFPEIPERTLRYRTRRLHDLGLAGRTRPYRDRGSASNHHWPTRRADCLMRGQPVPRGGERKRPNPIFLAHTAALTELYVALSTGLAEAGLSLHAYHREPREPFTDSAKERVLAPDAMVTLTDPQGRKLSAFVEIDLGTMSHTRLRAKAELYASYSASDAWRERHPFLPALLFLTTTDIRAAKFLKALARALSYGPRRDRRRAFVAGGAGIAWTPHQLLAEPCLADLDGNTRLTLLDILNAAREPHEQALAYRRERQEAKEEERRHLCEEPVAMREHLRRHEHTLSSYFQVLGEPGVNAIKLLLSSHDRLLPDERGALRAIARDLGEALTEPGQAVDPPGAEVVSEIVLLTEDYLATQTKQVRALAASHGEGPSLRRAWDQLREGGLLDPTSLDQLPQDAEHDAAGRREQHERRDAYLNWREQTARQLARKAGPLGRLTHRPGDFYPQLDRERLKVCGRCGETIYPRARDGDGFTRQPSCHYCREAHGIKPYDPTSTAGQESEAYK
jgi:Replication-relaxation